MNNNYITKEEFDTFIQMKKLSKEEYSKEELDFYVAYQIQQYFTKNGIPMVAEHMEAHCMAYALSRLKSGCAIKIIE